MDSNAFLFMDESYPIPYIHHNFLIHSSLDGHLGCFRVLAIISSVAMNNRIHVSLSVLISSRYMPRSGIPGSYGGFIPSLLRNCGMGREMGGSFKREGIYVYLWLIHVEV